MSNNVQMPMDFLVSVLRLTMALESFELDADTETLCKTIEMQIQAKLEAIDKRKIFTNYKTAAVGSDEREQKRNEYLDKSGVHKDWRTQIEKHI